MARGMPRHTICSGPHASPQLPMFRLVTLGGLALLTPSGESPVAPGHRRKLALLAVLALADAPLERDTLVEMF